MSTSSPHPAKTSFNMPVELRERYKVACIQQHVQMSDMVVAFMELWTKAAETGKEVPDTEQLRKAEFQKSGKVIAFAKAKRAGAAPDDYGEMLAKILEQDGPKAEAIRAVLVALTAESSAPKRQTRSRK